MKYVRKLGYAVPLAVIGSQVNAAGIDFTPMTGSVDTTTVVAAIVAFGAIYLGPGFAKWAVKKVGAFFG